MKTHELKTHPPHFEDVHSGAKRVDVRKDDRGFSVGDVLVLREFCPAAYTYAGMLCEARYTGRVCEVRVTHVLRDIGGLDPEHVALSIRLVAPPAEPAIEPAIARAVAAEREAIRVALCDAASRARSDGSPEEASALQRFADSLETSS